MTFEQINEIRDLIADTHEVLCEGEVTQYDLAQLYEVIKRLMDATAKARDKGMRVALASLEYAARKEKALIEKQLAIRN
ncbi:hypothetical protein ACFL3F_01700 [Planctomycetota bacterium]